MESRSKQIQSTFEVTKLHNYSVDVITGNRHKRECAKKKFKTRKGKWFRSKDR